MRGGPFSCVGSICPSVGECQGQEAGVGGLGSRAEGGYRELSEKKLGKGVASEM